MSDQSDLLYGRQAGRVVPNHQNADEALAAIDRARQAATDWPSLDESEHPNWTDDEWRACASFARIHQQLGQPLSAREDEALRRHPHVEPAGSYFADHIRGVVHDRRL